MKLNVKSPTTIRTHEGAPATAGDASMQLRRAVMSCLLWEDQFYEDGQTIADRIAALIPTVQPEHVQQMAIEARQNMNLRHAPLLLAREMLRYPAHRNLVADTLEEIIQRPDELAEFLAIYWKDGKCSLAAQAKKGLARAFGKFNAYNLSKYNRDGDVKLRDVLFLTHAKPKDAEQAAVWKQLVDGTLAAPDTWEVALSAGSDKKETWKRLIAEEKLGALALIRNLRNMKTAGVEDATIKSALLAMKPDRVLPFRFIAAARYAPQFEPELEEAMFKNLAEQPRLSGETILLVDVSPSMEAQLSGKSEMTRMEAAFGLAMLLRELGACRIFSFSGRTVEVPPRRGFALRDAIATSQARNGTLLGQAVRDVQKFKTDRLIVISDEESQDVVGGPGDRKGYMINVASTQNGVGYGDWTRISGWSESIIKYIQTVEG